MVISPTAVTYILFEIGEASEHCSNYIRTAKLKNTVVFPKSENYEAWCL